MKVLIIEDFEPIALGMQKIFTDRGHQCDCIIGVRSFQPFIGVALDKQDIAIDPSEYDVVLCDFELVGKIRGPAIVHDLTARGIPCVAMSSVDSCNDEMVANGALMGFFKLTVLAALIEGDLTAEGCRTGTPDVIATVSAYHRDRLLADLDLRGKIEAIITSH